MDDLWGYLEHNKGISHSGVNNIFNGFEKLGKKVE